jgi:plastocyanin
MSRVLRIGSVALLASALLLTAGPAPADTARVRARGDSPTNFRWSPDFQHILKGNKIAWKNATTTTHHVVAYGGNWSYNESVPAGEAVRKRFRRTGVYKYRCDIPGHSSLSPDGTCDGMCGVIHVTR